MIQALLLKIAALSLLVMLGQNPNLPADFRANAEDVASRALIAAEAELAKPEQSTSSSTPSAPTPPAETTASSISNNQPAPQPMPEAPASQSRIEIISPIPGSGIGGQFATST